MRSRTVSRPWHACRLTLSRRPFAREGFAPGEVPASSRLPVSFRIFLRLMILLSGSFVPEAAYPAWDR